MIAALSVGIWLSALTVRYRDFQHIVPFMVQIGLYVTPIAYPAEFAMQQLPKWAAAIYYLNPMAGVVQGFWRRSSWRINVCFLCSDFYPFYFRTLLLQESGR
jgi:ABC-type polysaccharide/polyol phosphate export permease